MVCYVAKRGLEWFIGWQDRRQGIAKTIGASRPRLATGLLIKSTHRAAHVGLTAVEFFLEIQRPFSSTTRFTDPWAVPLLAQFDGSRSMAEVHSSARLANEIPADFKLEDFAKLVLVLIERGYIEVPEWPLPTGTVGPQAST